MSCVLERLDLPFREHTSCDICFKKKNMSQIQGNKCNQETGQRVTRSETTTDPEYLIDLDCIHERYYSCITRS